MASLFPAGPGFGGSIHVAILVLLLLFFSKESEAGTKRFGDCSRAHCENGRTGEFTGAGNDVALFRARLLADQTRRGGYLMLGGTGPARRIALRRPESIRAPGLVSVQPPSRSPAPYPSRLSSQWLGTRAPGPFIVARAPLIRRRVP